MKLIFKYSIQSWAALMLVMVCALSLGACNLLKSGTTEPPSFYSLNVAPRENLLAPRGDARMLGPLLASAMARTGVFGAVVVTPAAASVDLRLETEIIRLQHNFQTSPSRVQFTLRAFLLDDKTRRVLAWRELRGEAVSAGESPQGGVAAANQAVQTVLNAVMHALYESLARLLLQPEALSKDIPRERVQRQG
jgi:cholesterol transport system auxiliary component